MIAFWILAIVLIASAMWVITASKPVYSVVGLLVHFTALAFMFITLSAEFLAAIQIIVYSGAILVLFVFVIALLSSGVAPFSLGEDRLPKIAVPAIVLTVIALAATVIATAHVTLQPPTVAVANGARMVSIAGQAGEANVFGSVADFGKALFTVHLLPFEITAFILMVAVIGVVLLAGDQEPYAPSRERAAEVRREMREAILRGGEE